MFTFNKCTMCPARARIIVTDHCAGHNYGHHYLNKCVQNRLCNLCSPVLIHLCLGQELARAAARASGNYFDLDQLTNLNLACNANWKHSENSPNTPLGRTLLSSQTIMKHVVLPSISQTHFKHCPTIAGHPREFSLYTLWNLISMKQTSRKPNNDH